MKNSDVQKYLSDLIKIFEQNANPVLTINMSKYMRNMFPYFGIQTPVRREITKDLMNKISEDKNLDYSSFIKTLWNKPQREFQYFAVGYLSRISKQLKKKDIKLIEYLIINKSWWDTVDSVATDAAADYFKLYPQEITKTINAWSKSGNIWLIRSAILFQLGYKSKTDTRLLFKLIKKHSSSKEFFIQKAIGWALRQCSYTDSQAVLTFVNNNDLAPLSKREALKRIS